MGTEALKYDYAETGYSTPYNHGSTAPDYTIPREFDTPLPKEKRRVREKTKVKVKPKEEAKVSTKFGIPLTGIIGFVLIAALMVLMLNEYVALAELSAQKASLESELSALEEENSKLRISYESEFNIGDIEKYAVNVLGMMPLTEEDSKVIEIEREDMSEIIAEDDSKSDFLESIIEAVNSFLEYFY